LAIELGPTRRYLVSKKIHLSVILIELPSRGHNNGKFRKRLGSNDATRQTVVASTQKKAQLIVSNELGRNTGNFLLSHNL
jgi:hypothetical protein